MDARLRAWVTCGVLFLSLCVHRINLSYFLIILADSSTANESDESDDIPSDVDLSDPFFSQEIKTGISNKNKLSTGKTKTKRKRAAPETEGDRKAKVGRNNTFIDNFYISSNGDFCFKLYIALGYIVFLQIFTNIFFKYSTFRADVKLNSRRTLLTNASEVMKDHIYGLPRNI